MPVEELAGLAGVGAPPDRVVHRQRLPLKIRNAELEKIPYILIIGEAEVAAGGVAPRRRGGEDLKAMSLDAFLELLRAEATPPY